MFLVTLEHAGVGEICYVCGAAARANDLAIGPAEIDHEVVAVVGIRKEDDGFLQGVWSG